MLVLRSGNDDPNLIGRGSTLICRRLTGLKWRYCCRRLFSAKVGAVDVAKLSFRFWDLLHCNTRALLPFPGADLHQRDVDLTYVLVFWFWDLFVTRGLFCLSQNPMRKFLFVVAIVLAILAGVDASKKAGRPPKPSPVLQARDVRTDWAGVRIYIKLN